MAETKEDLILFCNNIIDICDVGINAMEKAMCNTIEQSFDSGIIDIETILKNNCSDENNGPTDMDISN